MTELWTREMNSITEVLAAQRHYIEADYVQRVMNRHRCNLPAIQDLINEESENGVVDVRYGTTFAKCLQLYYSIRH